ncbi:MAG: glycosyltransferase family 2 protein [Clostridiales bacterium]|jgi:GT2 family glycosyltransferase|nr:glycosyltransferase family 2 protein [Clostridiales bacterium]
MYQISKLIYPKSENICEETALYFKGEGIRHYDVSIKFLRKTEVSFGTYFNSISYGDLLKYTDIQDITFRINILGDATVRLMCATSDINELAYAGVTMCCTKKKPFAKKLEKKLKKDPCIKCSNYTYSLLNEKKFQCPKTTTVELTVDISRLDGVGVIFAEVEGVSGTTLYGGEYLTSIPPKRESKLGVIFSLRKRLEFMKDNIRRINIKRALDKSLAEKVGIFVIDNGDIIPEKDLTNTMVFKNEKTGEAGGFSKGIREVCERKEYTHFVLFDDDVYFETEVLNKIIFWTEYAKKPDALTIGGGILNMHKPYELVELGAFWSKDGQKFNKQNLDLRNLADIVRSECNEPTNYVTWRCCCMSVKIVEKMGLPLPFYVKSYDAEYSLRVGNDILLTTGIGVWHEEDLGKPIGPTNYYIKRNNNILEAIYFPQKGIRRLLKDMWHTIHELLIYQRYQEKKIAFKGYDDFLSGPDYFLRIRADELHESLVKEKQPVYTKEELIEQGYDISEEIFFDEDDAKTHWLYGGNVHSNYIIPHFLFPKYERKGFRLVDFTKLNSRVFYKANKVVQYNPLTKEGFVTRLSKREYLRTAYGLIKRSIKIIFTYHFVARDYRLMLQNYKKSTRISRRY